MKVILVALRKRAGLTVREAADSLGVQRQTVYAWESGDKTPEPASLRALMELYAASDEDRARIASLRAFGPDEAAGAA